MKSRICSSILLTVIVLTVLAPTLVYAATPAIDYTKYLTSLGVLVPSDNVPNPVQELEVYTPSVYLSSVGGWYIVSVPGQTSYIVEPGYPLLPLRVVELVIDGYVRDVKVKVIVKDVEIIKLSKPIIPASKPLAFCPNFIDKLYGRNISLIAPDPKVYSLDKFLPGFVVKKLVLHGLLGKTVVLLYVAPLLYNPVKNIALLVKDMDIIVGYEAAYQVSFNTKGMAILTSEKLVDVVNKTLVPIYRSLGYNVSIVTVEDIWKRYKPAENITRYPGFYTVRTKDYVYKLLSERYNWTLALKIISFLRANEGKFAYLLIVGNATTVPPSFYYFSYMSYRYLGPYEAWIPTDFFYASYDYDLLPNIFVGRIPFSNPMAIETYAAKLMIWYKTLANRTPVIALTGGYPFLTPLLFGEGAIATMLNRSLNNVSVLYFTRTDENYDNITVKNILAGKYGVVWYFAIAHGSGDAMWDPKIVDFERYTWECLASISDLMKMRPSMNLSIVSSVACDNAIWDNALMPMLPLSFGQAVLLSPAAGVAYIGSARVAWEILAYEMSKGLLVVDYYGATRLHEDMLRAYASLAGKVENVSLGYVVAMGMLNYLKDVLPEIESYSEYIIVQTVFFELSLLGDPTIVLPVPKPIAKAPKVISLEPKNYSVMISTDYMEIPFYRYPNTIVYSIVAIPSTYRLKVVRVWTSPGILYYEEPLWWPWLTYLDIVYSESVDVKNVVDVEITPSVNVSGLLLMYVESPFSIARSYSICAGLTVTPAKTSAGAPIAVEGFGMDVLGARTMYLYVAGRYITSLTIPPSGYLKWVLALPYLAPGRYSVFLMSPYPTPMLQKVLKYFEAYVEVVAVEKLVPSIAIPSAVEVGKELNMIITVTLNGKPINASVSLLIVAPNGEKKTIEAEPLAEGVYLAKFVPSIPGVYTIYVNASYVKGYVVAYGYSVVSFAAVKNFYSLSDIVENSTKELKSAIASATTELSSAISEAEKSLSNKISSAGSVIIKEITSAATSISTVIENVNASMSKLISSTKESIETKVSEAVDTLKSELSSSVKTVTSNINAAAKELKSFVERKSSYIVDNIKSEVDKSSSELKKEIDTKMSEVKKDLGNVTILAGGALGSSIVALGLLGVALTRISRPR